MKTFLISYDLGIPEKRADYFTLADHLKTSYSIWARPVKSVWLIKSKKSARQIKDEIKSVLDENDKLIVIEVKGHWATRLISTKITDWMKKNI